MTDSEILELAKSVREWLIPEAVKNGMPADMQGMCAIAALELSRRLEERGVKLYIANSAGVTFWHCWLVVAGKVLDVTATQFGGPEVYFGADTRPGWFGYQGRRRTRATFVRLVKEAPMLKRDWLTEDDRAYIRNVQAYA